ncbi:hypothetical protein M0804_002124 [Polistes exclamans]|nr:hypothetical protein M0804_002124 [Polistes exclamans]
MYSGQTVAMMFSLMSRTSYLVPSTALVSRPLVKASVIASITVAKAIEVIAVEYQTCWFVTTLALDSADKERENKYGSI